MNKSGEEYNNDTDEQLLYAYQQYFFWIDKFKRHGFMRSSVYARRYLKQIRELADKRRKEILIERKSVEKK